MIVRYVSAYAGARKPQRWIITSLAGDRFCFNSRKAVNAWVKGFKPTEPFIWTLYGADKNGIEVLMGTYEFKYRQKSKRYEDGLMNQMFPGRTRSALTKEEFNQFMAACKRRSREKQV